MSTTLPIARETFVAAMNRETSGSDRPRYMAVLESFLEWTLARPDQLTFRSDESARGVLSFLRVGSNVVFWSVKPMRNDCPQIELLPRAAAILGEEDREVARQALNALSRTVLEGDDKLRIGFSAMKNEASRAAMFSLMSDLLEKVH